MLIAIAPVSTFLRHAQARCCKRIAAGGGLVEIAVI
jgi:hypothetical protein